MTFKDAVLMHGNASKFVLGYDVFCQYAPMLIENVTPDPMQIPDYRIFDIPVFFSGDVPERTVAVIDQDDNTIAVINNVT